MNKILYAETLGHYWQTSRSSPDQWIEKAKRQIASIGGKVLAEGFGASEGKEAYMLGFEFSGERFRIVWPVLPSKTGNTLSARRQAATLLYHDIKAKCMTSKVIGKKAAFFSYLMLPDGRIASELASPELAKSFPPLLKGES